MTVYVVGDCRYHSMLSLCDGWRAHVGDCHADMISVSNTEGHTDLYSRTDDVFLAANVLNLYWLREAQNMRLPL